MAARDHVRESLPVLDPLVEAGRLPLPVTSRLISVVVPLYNEEATVTALYEELRAAFAASPDEWEVIYVDDGSTDGSYQELVRLHAAYTNVRVIRLRRNFGKAHALAAGFDAVAGDVVVTIDADLQDDPREIPRLVEMLDEGYDLVSGWKRDRQDPAARRAFSHLYNATTSWVTGVKLHDMNCGLKVYRAEVLQNVRLYGDMHRFVAVLAHHLGYRMTEIPVNHRPRLHGSSRFGVERYTRGFFDLFTVAFMGRYRYRPMHLFGGVGMLLGGTGLVILVYLTILKAGGAGIGERPLLLLGVLFVVVGIQFFSLGLVGEMLTSHHSERTASSDARQAHIRDVLR